VLRTKDLVTCLVFGGSGKRHASAIVIDDTTCEPRSAGYGSGDRHAAIETELTGGVLLTCLRHGILLSLF
jgi:hypothetical protein